MENKQINNLLINACQNEYKHKNKNTLETIKYLISNGADVNFGNFYNQSPLHFACQNQNENKLEIIKYLIEKGADINALTKNGETPLHIVCQYQKENILEIIKYLIEKGADINIKSQYYYNQTPLHYVCQYQKENALEIIKYLISKGADINAKTQKEEIPLHLICQYQKENTLEIIKYLIKKGLDVNALSKYSQTALHSVCQYQKQNTFEIIKYLIKKGADINVFSKYSQTPLHYACQFQKKDAFEIIKYLISKGADINAKNSSKKTPLHYACQYQNKYAFEIIKYLIEKGADINARTGNKDETPLSMACQYQKHQETIKVIKYLIKNGADIHAKVRFESSILEFISQHKNKFSSEIIKCLIKKGLDVNAKYKDNQTPSHMICLIHNENAVDLMKLLIKKGADINIKNNFNELPLQYVIHNRNENQELTKLLIMNESDISDSDIYEINEEIVDVFLKTHSINQDLNNLLNSNDNLSDFEIKTNYSFKFKVHKQILLLRFDYNKSILQKFINNCLQKPKEIVEIVINFIYTGFPNFNNFIQKFQILKNYLIKIDELKKNLSHQRFYEETEKIQEELKKEEEELKIKETKQNEINEEFFKEIGFDSNWIKSKSKRKGIIKDLSKLYKENNSKKDFTIICEEKEIKVHKLILFLRSELFKGMFQLNIQDKSNQVHDYSRKSFETINQFIYFLYHDKIEENKFNSKITEEFEDIKDYFQLNQNSIIDLFLNDLISSNKFKNIKKRK
ncbi:cyclin-dependent kinase inhibitor 2c [Anaeramoeba ignava]|uniref:Cyclin-dependent kinase inhibitor 2c n=1 Tax=Anaeramoeba ignava TaxID=1746090 RepID=A0A9Q0LFE2_ANAIG|nr:cyclin-dependent kinase inhibitor 2c [Anaeramoeba ignava]